jgi:hypothetical protein
VISRGAHTHRRAQLPWAEGTELDLRYLRHHDWKTDPLILLAAPLALFGGAYKGRATGWKASGG